MAGARQTTLGLSATAIFADLAGSSSKTSEIRQAVLYDDMLPPVDWQLIAYASPMNDLERLFDVKIRFRSALLESERLSVRNSTTSAILRCSMRCTIN